MVEVSYNPDSDKDMATPNATEYESSDDKHDEKPKTKANKERGAPVPKKDGNEGHKKTRGNGNFQKANRKRVLSRDQIPSDEVEEFDSIKAAEIREQLRAKDMMVSGAKVEIWNRLKGREDVAAQKTPRQTTTPDTETPTPAAPEKAHPKLTGNGNFKKSSKRRTQGRDTIPDDEIEDFDQAKAVDLMEKLRKKEMKVWGKKAELWTRLKGRDPNAKLQELQELEEPKGSKQTEAESSNTGATSKVDDKKPKKAAGPKVPGNSNFKKASQRRARGREELSTRELARFDASTVEDLKSQLMSKDLSVSGNKMEHWNKIREAENKIEQDSAPQDDSGSDTEETGFETDSDYQPVDVSQGNEETDVDGKMSKCYDDPISEVSESEDKDGHTIKHPKSLEESKEPLRDDQKVEIKVEDDTAEEDGNGEGAKSSESSYDDGRSNTEKTRKRNRSLLESPTTGRASKRRCRSLDLRGGQGSRSDENRGYKPGEDVRIDAGETVEVDFPNFYIHMNWLNMTIPTIRAIAPGAVQADYIPVDDAVTFSEYLQKHTEQRVYLARLRYCGNSPLQGVEEESTAWAYTLPAGFGGMNFVDVLDTAPMIWQLLEGAKYDAWDDLFHTRSGQRHGWHGGLLGEGRFGDTLRQYPRIADFLESAVDNGELELENPSERGFLRETIIKFASDRARIDPEIA